MVGAEAHRLRKAIAISSANWLCFRKEYKQIRVTVTAMPATKESTRLTMGNTYHPYVARPCRMSDNRTELLECHSLLQDAHSMRIMPPSLVYVDDTGIFLVRF